MKLLVTGGAGFIGSAVVRQAVASGLDVVNLDKLTYAACLDNVASVADSPTVRFEISLRRSVETAAASSRPLVVKSASVANHTRCSW